MATELKLLQEEQQDIVRGLQDLCGRVKKDNRSFSPEEKAEYDQKFSRQQELSEQIETIKRSQQVEALSVARNVERYEPHQVYSAARNIEKEGLAMRGWFLTNNEGEEKVTDRMRQAAYDLGVSLNSPHFIIRQQSVGTNSEGGYLRTPSAFDGLEKAMKHFAAITEVCTVRPAANGNPTFWATVNDTANTAVQTNELATMANQSVSVGKIDMAFHKFSDMVAPVSNELFEDSEFPIDALLNDIFGERIGRKVANHTALGDLTNNKGFITESTLGVTTASETAITIAEVLNLKASVDYAYQKLGGRWYCNYNTYNYLKKLVDSNGRPLLMPDFANGGLEKIDGDPITIVPDMADIAEDNIVLAYGPASKYVWRPVKQARITRLNELYAEEDAVGFTLVLRGSGRLVQPNAIKHLRMKAAA